MADLTGFRQRLADRAEADKGLPPVNLKMTSDFDMDLAKLVTVDNRKDDETDAQVTQRYIDEICDQLAKPENEEIAKKVGSVINAFVEKIKTAKQSLHDVRNNARELAEIMEKGKTDLLAKDPFVSTHLNLTKLSVDYPTWEWSGPKLIGAPTYIKERVGALITAKDADIPTDYDYRLFMMGLNSINSKIKFVDAPLADDVKTTFIDSICETLGESVTKETVIEVVESLVGPTKTTRAELLDLSRLTNLNPADLFTQIKSYDGFIQKYYPIAEAVSDGQVELPEVENIEDLKSNAENLKTLCEFMAYFELMERETVFKQSILLQGGLLNADEKAAYTEAGGTDLMIAHYIRFMYKDDVQRIPARGISSKVIIESAAHNEKIVKADMCNIENRIAVATTQARVSVFTTVAHRYIVNKVDRENPEETPARKSVLEARFMNGVVKKIAERIHHHDIAFVDAALMLIVEVDYHGTFVEQMYNQLGAAYLAKAQEAENGEVTDLDMQVAEMGVVAKMVAGFVVANLVEVVQVKDYTNHAPIVPNKED